MDTMKRRSREARIRAVMDDLGASRETAEFAVALADAETAGGIGAITLPLPEAEAKRRATLLVEQHGFTLDEATRYVAGDRAPIEAVAARRRAEEEGNSSSIDSSAPASVASAD